MIKLSDYTDTDRMFFFESLREMLEKSSQVYERLFLSCVDVRSLIEQTYPELPQMESTSALQSLPVDMHAKTLLPEQWKHVTPLKCEGDGNCLYRYAFINIDLGYC